MVLPRPKQTVQKANSQLGIIKKTDSYQEITDYIVQLFNRAVISKTNEWFYAAFLDLYNKQQASSNLSIKQASELLGYVSNYILEEDDLRQIIDIGIVSLGIKVFQPLSTIKYGDGIIGLTKCIFNILISNYNLVNINKQLSSDWCEDYLEEYYEGSGIIASAETLSLQSSYKDFSKMTSEELISLFSNKNKFDLFDRYLYYLIHVLDISREVIYKDILLYRPGYTGNIKKTLETIGVGKYIKRGSN